MKKKSLMKNTSQSIKIRPGIICGIGRSHHFLSDHETLQRKSKSLSSIVLLFRLSLIEQTEGVDVGKNQIQYNLEEYKFSKDRNNLDTLSNNLHIEHAIRSLMIFSTINDTIRIWVSASRFDISFILIHIVKFYVTEVL